MLGHEVPALGERVELSVDGEVMAYPRPGSATEADAEASSEAPALLTGQPSR